MALILVVDDSTFTRSTISKFLKGEGHQVVTAENGRQAIEKIEEHNPDCMLLDLLMPDMDGIDVLKVLDKNDKDIPVVIVSADIQQTTRDECDKYNVAKFLNKPIDWDQLRSAIDHELSV